MKRGQAGSPEKALTRLRNRTTKERPYLADWAPQFEHRPPVEARVIERLTYLVPVEDPVTGRQMVVEVAMVVMDVDMREPGTGDLHETTPAPTEPGMSGVQTDANRRVKALQNRGEFSRSPPDQVRQRRLHSQTHVQRRTAQMQRGDARDGISHAPTHVMAMPLQIAWMHHQDVAAQLLQATRAMGPFR